MKMNIDEAVDLICDQYTQVLQKEVNKTLKGQPSINSDVLASIATFRFFSKEIKEAFRENKKVDEK